MKKRQTAIRLLLAAAIVLAAVPPSAAEVPAIRRADSLPGSTPWNLDQLGKPPKYEWAEGDGIRSLQYEGEPYQGKSTRVFAHYATPGTLAGDPSMDKNLPAVVLLHGGNGRAFGNWVELWAKRGYAAIAMDLNGRGPQSKQRLPDGGPPMSHEIIFGAISLPVTEQWTYHAVANAIRAHSLLLSFPEVDPQRTAVIGISWGGYLTCIVAGLDQQFKAAAPVYDCGFLHENSGWLKGFRENVCRGQSQLGAALGPLELCRLSRDADAVHQWRQRLRLPSGQSRQDLSTRQGAEEPALLAKPQPRTRLRPTQGPRCLRRQPPQERRSPRQDCVPGNRWRTGPGPSGIPHQTDIRGNPPHARSASRKPRQAPVDHADRLGLDDFWQPLLPDSRKGTPWLKVLKTLTVYRLLAPGSEWHLHTSWFDRSAMADLLDDNFRLAAKDTLYRCHDRLLEHKPALFTHLKERWSGLFGATYDILLYDLTSSYFEVDANGPVAESSNLKAFGYSRDKRPDCLQIVIALIITPDGLPIGYEIMRGNTSDKTTLRETINKITAQHGKEGRTWIMDRGIPTEDVLGEMRAADPTVRYLVGTPKGRLTKLEKQLAEKDWQDVKDDVRVKLLPHGNELYLLARSLPRRAKESAMRRKKLRAYWNRLKALRARPNLGRDELLLAIGAAKQKAGRNAHRLVTLTLPANSQSANPDTFRFHIDKPKLRTTCRDEGQYLLRSNLTGEDPAALWRNYMNLVRIEESFRTLKGDLGLRPIHHQLDGRIESHIMISFLAYCLHVTLEKYNKKATTGLSARNVLARLGEIQMLDVSIPVTDGRALYMRRHTKPEKLHQLLLDRLGFVLPAQLPPEIRGPAVVVETF